MLYWHWFAIGILLMALELALPSFFFLWLGVAALVAGVALFLAPSLTFAMQGVVFAVAAIIAFYVGRKYFKGRLRDFSPSTLNKRGARMVGNLVTLESAIVNGKGKAQVGDSLWSVEGDEDLPAGTTVKVIGADGTVLKVTKA